MRGNVNKDDYSLIHKRIFSVEIPEITEKCPNKRCFAFLWILGGLCGLGM
jgi:hypothetical protein